jgi:hypothetical protein
LTSCLTLLLAVTPVTAQSDDEIRRLTLQPAGEPSPALKYQLLPRLSDQTPGNAVQLYYRAYSPEWLSHRRDPDFYKKLDKWLETPPRDLPREELKWVLTYAPLGELDLGARCEQCDWLMTDRVRKEGPYLRLPDMQGFRDLANLLVLRARLQMAGGHYDQAVATLQTGFALARHVGQGPIVICSLVGVAIATSMAKEVETLIQMPGAPNLYWALTDLPRPLFDLRKPLQGEQIIWDSILPSLAELEKTPLSQDRLQEILRRSFPNARLLDIASIQLEPEAEAQVAFTGLVVKYYPQAKRFLADHGRKPAAVEAMPAPQVVLIYSLVTFRRLQDEMFKWANVPYPDARAGLRRANQQLQQLKEDQQEGIPLASWFLPAVDKVFVTQARTDRQIAALRCIEAIRLHVAAHDGRLPRQLSEITEVPVPRDPVTGEPFEYRIDGDRATLIARPPAGDSQPPPLHYELTFKR